MNNEILTIKNLKTYFLVNKSKSNPLYVKAVDGVSFSIKTGEIMGLVGESGSGKSTIAYTIMGMHKPREGEILFEGKNIINKNYQRDFTFKKNVQIVFQDPGSSLNPYQDVQQVLSLPLKVHKIVPKNQIESKIVEILKMVELPDNFMFKSATSIGGGEKQLVSIARALCCNPKFIILDEPTSSLDVSIQAKIINMLLKIHREQRLTYLFITHDLSLMRNVATKVVIMYLGKICEIALTEELYKNPLHPYSQMLFSSIPVISEEEALLKPKKVISKGEIPSPVNIPLGCGFNTRCNQKIDICHLEDPKIVEVSSNHFVRCHLYYKNNTIQ
jgi:peptide/nickel transport system ATP-binding protein